MDATPRASTNEPGSGNGNNTKVRESRCVICGGSFQRDSRSIGFAVESFNYKSPFLLSFLLSIQRPMKSTVQTCRIIIQFIHCA